VIEDERGPGWFGDAYLAAIRPFRHHLVYPPLMRHIARQWRRIRSARV
jgi:hypothetical protein